CFATWCNPCFNCIVAKDHGECLCLPLLECWGFIPPIAMAMRVSTRLTYGIE
ncbi:cornifelin B-like, partial [Clarias magur]